LDQKKPRFFGNFTIAEKTLIPTDYTIFVVSQQKKQGFKRYTGFFHTLKTDADNLKEHISFC
jgi:hypothetical protein